MQGHSLTNQCTRIAKQRLIENGWACGVTLASKAALLARNRVISSVSRYIKIRLLEKKAAFSQNIPLNLWYVFLYI